MHSDFYRENRPYAERLRDDDPRKFQAFPQLGKVRPFHEKYVRALSAGRAEGEVIVDVGCGAGQVVRSLTEGGFRGCGVDVSEASLALAREFPGEYQLFDGRTLPFPSGSVGAIGAFNVLEHVERPTDLLDEMGRVLRPGGRFVVSSPNFLRVVGWRDYHPHMRGLRRKAANLRTQLRHRRLYRGAGATVLFEKMTPLYREPFRPDDDAIAATSAYDFRRYFLTRGFREVQVSCVDRPLPGWLEGMLDATPLRYVMLNSFVTATKPLG